MMKRVLACLLVTAFLLSMMVTVVFAEGTAMKVVGVKHWVRIRKGPSIQTLELCQVPVDTVLQAGTPVEGEDGDGFKWIPVTYTDESGKDISGYIREDKLEVIEAKVAEAPAEATKAPEAAAPEAPAEATKAPEAAAPEAPAEATKAPEAAAPEAPAEATKAPEAAAPEAPAEATKAPEAAVTEAPAEAAKEEAKPAEAAKEEAKPTKAPKEEAKPTKAPKKEAKATKAPKEEAKPTKAPKKGAKPAETTAESGAEEPLVIEQVPAPQAESTAAIDAAMSSKAPIKSINDKSKFEDDSIILDTTVGDVHVVARRIVMKKHEYLMVVGLDASGNQLWMHETMARLGAGKRTDAFIGGTVEKIHVYMYNEAISLAAIKPADGKVRWEVVKDKVDLGYDIAHTGSAIGTLYVGGFAQPEPVAIDRKGKILWQANSGDQKPTQLRKIYLREDGVAAKYDQLATGGSGTVIYDYETGAVVQVIPD